MTIEREGSLEPTEYVLGLMDPHERRAFELALLDDPGLAEEVWQAEGDFAPLQNALKPRPLPPRVKKAIDKQIFGDQAAPVVQRGGSRLGVVFWRGVASFLGIATAAAAAVIAVLVLRPGALLPQEEPYMAAILGEGGVVTLARIRSDGALVTEAFDGPLAADRDPELWIIHGENAPLSLGVLAKNGQTIVPLNVLAADVPLAGSLLVVTDEPLGGSPSGDPTGPAIAQGPLRQI
ncbi:MAG: anti-sigma factor [Pseudomonadota bacterium]